MGGYKFTTFREAFHRIEVIGRGLLSLGVKPGDKILIFAETRAEWLLTALAALRHGLVIVTLYSTLGEEAVKYGINESQVSIILTSNELLPKLEVRALRSFGPHFRCSENPRSNKSCSSCGLLSSDCQIATSETTQSEE